MGTQPGVLATAFPWGLCGHAHQPSAPTSNMGVLEPSRGLLPVLLLSRKSPSLSPKAMDLNPLCTPSGSITLAFIEGSWREWP